MPSPFFSGRIPQSLFDAVEEYRQRTGELKTDILVRALSAYIDVPLESTPAKNQETGLLETERLNLLEERIATVERQLLDLQQRSTDSFANARIDSDELMAEVHQLSEISRTGNEISDEKAESLTRPNDEPDNGEEETAELNSAATSDSDNKVNNETEVIDSSDNKFDNKPDNVVSPTSLYLFEPDKLTNGEIANLSGIKLETVRSRHKKNIPILWDNKKYLPFKDGRRDKWKLV